MDRSSGVVEFVLPTLPSTFLLLPFHPLPSSSPLLGSLSRLSSLPRSVAPSPVTPQPSFLPSPPSALSSRSPPLAVDECSLLNSFGVLC